RGGLPCRNCRAPAGGKSSPALYCQATATSSVFSQDANTSVCARGAMDSLSASCLVVRPQTPSPRSSSGPPPLPTTPTPPPWLGTPLPPCPEMPVPPGCELESLPKPKMVPIAIIACPPVPSWSTLNAKPSSTLPTRRVIEVAEFCSSPRVNLSPSAITCSFLVSASGGKTDVDQPLLTNLDL